MRLIPKAMLAAVMTSALLTAGCGGAQDDAPQAAMQDPQSLSGQVSYRERRLLTPGSRMIVSLEDLSRQDVAATVLASLDTEVQGPPPYPFVLTYDRALIKDENRYGLRIRIEEDGQLVFTNDQHIDPFAGDVLEVVVRGVQL